jgi:cation diffusion facilitator CzcD-associated flavoprotein CzcO
MPAGMSLKSEGFASNLSHPDGLFTLEDFCAEQGIPYAHIGVPVTLETFASYGLAFQQRFVPNLEEAFVTDVSRQRSGFRLTLETGEIVYAERVVVAAGIRHFGAIPEALASLSPDFVSHSSRFHTYEQFKGQDVLVVGAGSSAVDVALALDRAGARPQLITRRTHVPFHGKAPDRRSLITRVRAPWSGLGPSWRSKLCCDLPLVFHSMPPEFRLKVVKKHLGPVAGWFTHEAMRDRVPMHVGLSLVRATQAGTKVKLIFVDQENNERSFEADHVVAGTGYYVDLERLKFLGDPMRKEIATIQDSPVLSKHFESTIPGLYFVGAAAAASFGPLLRFAFGADFTARHLSRHFRRLAHRKSRRWGFAQGKTPQRIDVALTESSEALQGVDIR